VSDSAAVHAGEVEIILTGHPKESVLFFEATMPFETKKYPLVSPPNLFLSSNSWQTIIWMGSTAKVRELVSR